MKLYELSEPELDELMDGYRDLALAEITMSAAQKKLLEDINKNVGTLLRGTDYWQSLLKDFDIK